MLAHNPVGVVNLDYAFGQKLDRLRILVEADQLGQVVVVVGERHFLAPAGNFGAP